MTNEYDGADELVTSIELPPRGFARNYTYLKIRDRLSYAFALVSIAVGLELDDGTIRILLGERERPQRVQAGVPDGAAEVKALYYPVAPLVSTASLVMSS